MKPLSVGVAASAYATPSPRPSLGAPLKRFDERLGKRSPGAFSETQSRSPIEAPGRIGVDAEGYDLLRDPVSEPH